MDENDRCADCGHLPADECDCLHICTPRGYDGAVALTGGAR